LIAISLRSEKGLLKGCNGAILLTMNAGLENGDWELLARRRREFREAEPRPKYELTTDGTDSADKRRPARYIHPCNPRNPWSKIFPKMSETNGLQGRAAGQMCSARTAPQFKSGGEPPHSKTLSRGAVVLIMAGLFLAFSFSASAQIQQAWVAKYNNGITNGNHQALKMALDNAGNIYVLGVSANANTNTGYVVLKYAQNGNQIWAARYDSTNFPSATPTGFAVDSGSNVVVTGSAVTLKYDADGGLLWSAPYAGLAIAVDRSQGIYITGISNSFTTAKFSPSGSNVWTASWQGYPYPNLSQVIAVDSSNVYVAGREMTSNFRIQGWDVALLKYDLASGKQIWEEAYGQSLIEFGYGEMEDLVIGASGRVYLEAYLPALPEQCQTLVYNSDGSLIGASSNPTEGVTVQMYGLAVDTAGNVLITGNNGVPDFYWGCNYGTIKLDTNVNFVWGEFYPSSRIGVSVATSIALDAGNNVYVAGYSAITDTNFDVATLKYDSDGNQVWLQRYDGPGHWNDAGNAIAVDNSGNVYVAGYETETNGFTSMILIKYSPVTIQKQSDGSVVLHAYGSPGESFDLQASTNLQTWQDLGTIAADTNGVLLFDDTNAAMFPSRFYYAVPK
jgi:hypothetical protein